MFSVPGDKEILKRRHFDNIYDIRTNTKAALKAIPQNRFQNCFEGWTRRWHRCVSSKGCTLKATTVVFSNEVFSAFTAMSSRTLLSDHVTLTKIFLVTKLNLTWPPEGKYDYCLKFNVSGKDIVC